MEQIILVDSNDNEIGCKEKEKCHRPPILHRAFSVLIFNGKGQMLIHKRSAKKKTWPGFWTNACCSHPRKGEDTKKAAERRLNEELGFSCDLKFLFKFEYKAMYDNEWGEHELDYVFEGDYDGPVKPDEDEVEEIKFVNVGELKKDIKTHPEKYTPWFRIALERAMDKVTSA